MPNGFRKFAPPGKGTGRVRKPVAKNPTLDSGKDLPLVNGSSSEYINTITALKRREQSDEALYLLQKIASMVKPVMRNHGLRVVSLCEFFPKDPRLLGLNVNHGLKICIRLRPASNERSFYPLTELLGTMLHELSHNKHGPHDDKFYKYMGELRSELEVLMAEGFTGDGFFSQGKTLGKSHFGPNGKTLSEFPTSRNGLVDPVKLAEAKRQEALRNETLNKKLVNKGKRLGGLTNNITQGLSVRELALRAAEQRLADAKWCGKASTGASNEDLGLDDDVIEINFIRKTDKREDFEVSEVEVIDLTED